MNSYFLEQIGFNSLEQKLPQLKSDGYILIEDALSKEYCDEIADFIDVYLDIKRGEYESGQLDTMQRIWGAEKYSAVVEDYKDKCSAILSRIFGCRLKPQSILAMRDTAIPFATKEEFDQFSKGRWHYDSWNDQYKIFLFLKDVNPENGPFEFIPRTNGAFRKRLAMTRPWWFFNPFTHFTTTKRPYQSISDARVQSIIDRGYPTVSLVVKQGAMLIVNPSALMHRASPIKNGRRYLAVAYF